MQEGIYTINIDGTGEQLIAPQGQSPSWQAVPVDPTPNDPVVQPPAAQDSNNMQATSNSTGVLAASTQVPKAPDTGFAPASTPSSLGIIPSAAAAIFILSALALCFSRVRQIIRGI